MVEVLLDGEDVFEQTQYRNLRVGLNTLDFTLVDPVEIPDLGDDAELVFEYPAFTGRVTSIEVKDFQETLYVKVTATNDEEALATPANFGLSDDPDDVTTFGYRDLVVSQTLKSGAYERRGRCKIFQPGLLPGMTFELTSVNQNLVAQEFSVTEVSISWPVEGSPVFDVSFGDAIVTLASWAVELVDEEIFPIDSTRITEGGIQTPSLAANSITADKLAATIILASLFKTANSGRRVEFDSNGIRLYDTDDTILVKIPTDGSPVYVAAQISATDLEVSGSARFLGDDVFLSRDTAMTLESAIADPSAAAVLDANWETISIEAWDASDLGLDPDDDSVYFAGGGYYDEAGGADGATNCYVMNVETYETATDSYPPYILEFKASDGSLDRVTELNPGTADFNTTSFVTRVGDHWYGVPYTGTILYKWLRSNGNLVATQSLTPDIGAGYTPVGITTDGTSVFIVVNSGATHFVHEYNTSLVHQTSLLLSGQPASFRGWGIQFLNEGSGDRFWVMDGADTAGSYPVYEFNASTGAVVANTSFPTMPGDGSTAIHNGTEFVTLTWEGGEGVASSLFKHTDWTWTTESPIYWVAYSWYDSAGTTHETLVSPLTSVTMGRRKRLSVTIPNLPGQGGADDPDNARVYIFPNATEPATASLDLQATSTPTIFHLTDYNSGGAAPPGSNDFPADGFATIRDSNDLIAITGEGKVQGGDVIAVEKLILPQAGIEAPTVDEGDLRWDEDDKTVYVGDGTTIRPVTPMGFGTRALPAGFAFGVAYTVAGALAAVSGGNAGGVVIPIDVVTPMVVAGYTLWSTDTANLRTAEARLYRMSEFGDTLIEVAGSDATWSFTPTAGAMRNSSAVSNPPLISAGQYWLAIRNTSASQTFNIGHNATAGTPAAALLFRATKSIPALGSTLSLASGWSAAGAIPCVVVYGTWPDGTTQW